MGHFRYICAKYSKNMTKYTHLTERCSSFMRSGAAWRLKAHGYTFSEAYWRLREGKGLLCAYDRETLEQWSALITAVRRGTAALSPLRAEDKRALKAKRESLLERMETYRDYIEVGTQPQYLYDGTTPGIMEHVLVMRTGNGVREADPTGQQQVWQSLDTESLRRQAADIYQEVVKYREAYAAAPENMKERMQPPQEREENLYGSRYTKDKVWQIRTGHDERSSVGAGINRRLYMIWDIPARTDDNVRSICRQNRAALDAYSLWKEENRCTPTPYDEQLKAAHDVLDRIEVPSPV